MQYVEVVRETCFQYKQYGFVKNAFTQAAPRVFYLCSFTPKSFLHFASSRVCVCVCVCKARSKAIICEKVTLSDTVSRSCTNYTTHIINIASGRIRTYRVMAQSLSFLGYTRTSNVFWVTREHTTFFGWRARSVNLPFGGILTMGMALLEVHFLCGHAELLENMQFTTKNTNLWHEEKS